jgi:hypothetical protein
MKKTGLHIIGDAPQPTWFTQIPNMAIQQLEVYSFKLLAVLMDIARTSSECWMSNKNLAKTVGCSVNRMKKARQELEQHGYIAVQNGTATAKATITVLFSDIWKMNYETYHSHDGVSPDDNGVSSDDNGVSPDDTLTKQYNITIPNQQEKISPLPPGETTKPEPEKGDGTTGLFKQMKVAVRRLKAYGKQADTVAKALLNLNADEDKNAGGQPFKPEDIPKFANWFELNYPSYTLPRNQQSCVKWFNIWRDTIQPAEPAIRIVAVEEDDHRNIKLMMQIAAYYENLEKEGA